MRVLLLLHRLIKSKGGYLALSKKVLSVANHEGFATVLFKIHMILMPRAQESVKNSDGHARDDYRYWLEKYDTLDQAQRENYVEQIKFWPELPKISVVMPTYNSNIEFLNLAIESVQQQLYPRWELCIADDCSSNPEVKALLLKKQEQDSRIQLCFRNENGHISRATNSALALVSTPWVALFDHDDLLSEDALFFVARHILRHPDVKIIYSDEDKINAQGERFSPHFKSDWNPELFFSQNFVSHLGVYSTELLRTIGGFRFGVEGAQDHDLVLRCLHHIHPRDIHHIPKVLYHWRAISGSTALNASAKSYADQARLDCIKNYFDSIHVPVTVSAGTLANTARVHYPKVKPEPLVSLLIPALYPDEALELRLQHLLKQTHYQNLEILLLIQKSNHEQHQNFKPTGAFQNARVKVIFCETRSQHLACLHNTSSVLLKAALYNHGASLAMGSILGLMANSLEVINSDWLHEMISLSTQSDIACVGAKLYDHSDQIHSAGLILRPTGTPLHSHFHFPKHHDGFFGRLKVPQAVSAISADCLLIKKELFQVLNGLREVELPLFQFDVDLCLSASALGYRNVWTPYAELRLIKGESKDLGDDGQCSEQWVNELKYMKNHWGSSLNDDPYYNPNLTLEHEDFSLAWGPKTHPFLSN